jgi:uroporphyrin-III C-methyltransferase/precorrin-2 dehydrogenase/sirohydrochlorin ferrochelatase
MSNVPDDQRTSRSGSRIGPLANLPVFFKLHGKRVVLVGGGEPALWKAELLAATGAVVEVFADVMHEGFRALASAPPNGRVILITRHWTPADLAGAALAIGAFEDEQDASAFASAAREAGVPVNVVDKPAFCDFQFGAIVNRSPLIVGISTDGAAPVFGQAIRSMIEGLLPEKFQLWAAAARDLRREGQSLGDTQQAKRGFWQRFTGFALANAHRAPTAADIDQLTVDLQKQPAREPVIVIEIGDSADDLTLRAVRALRAADDIFIDEAVSGAIADFSRREARRHIVSNEETSVASLVKEISEVANSGRRAVLLLHRPKAPAQTWDAALNAIRASGVPVTVLRASPPS